jgi:hypothetical protein
MTTTYHNGFRFDDESQAVAAPSERSATITQTSIADLTNTRQRVTFPSGAKWVQISYKLLPGATATGNQYAKLVFNAADVADAVGRLATVGAHIPVFQGDDLTFSFSDDNLCTVLDVVSQIAVGSEKTILRIVAGV